MTKYGDPIKFCWTCGGKVAVFKAHGHFDTTTGNEVVFNLYKCPNDRWWKLGHWVEPPYYVDYP